jgi:hypothetical protein
VYSDYLRNESMLSAPYPHVFFQSGVKVPLAR